jgi:hypothetical protein
MSPSWLPSRNDALYGNQARRWPQSALLRRSVEVALFATRVGKATSVACGDAHEEETAKLSWNSQRGSTGILKLGRL